MVRSLPLLVLLALTSACGLVVGQPSFPSSSSNLTNAGVWATPVPPFNLFSATLLYGVAQDTHYDELWYADSKTRGFATYNTTSGALQTVYKDAAQTQPMTSIYWDQDPATGVLYFVADWTTIYTGVRSSDGTVNITLLHRFEDFTIYGITADSNLLYISDGQFGEYRGWKSQIVNLTQPGQMTVTTMRASEQPCAQDYTRMPMTLNRETQELFWTCNLNAGVLVWDLRHDNLTAPGKQILTGYSCTMASVRRDPISRDLFLDCDSSVLRTDPDGSNARSMMAGFFAEHACGIRGVTFLFDQRLIFLACQTVGVIAIPMDPTPSGEMAPPALISMGFGSANLGQSGIPPTATRGRGEERIFISCFDGLTFVGGRSVTVLGTNICTIPSPLTGQMAPDGYGGAFIYCTQEATRRLVHFQGLNSVPVQVNAEWKNIQEVASRNIPPPLPAPRPGHPSVAPSASSKNQEAVWMYCFSRSTGAFLARYDPSSGNTTFPVPPRNPYFTSAEAHLAVGSQRGEVFVMIKEGDDGYPVILMVNQTTGTDDPDAPMTMIHIYDGQTTNFTLGVDVSFRDVETSSNRVFFIVASLFEENGGTPVGEVRWRPNDLSKAAVTVVPKEVRAQSGARASVRDPLKSPTCSFAVFFFLCSSDLQRRRLRSRPEHWLALHRLQLSRLSFRLSLRSSHVGRVLSRHPEHDGSDVSTGRRGQPDRAARGSPTVEDGVRHRARVGEWRAAQARARSRPGALAVLHGGRPPGKRTVVCVRR
jgi:hypothetical protein